MTFNSSDDRATGRLTLNMDQITGAASIQSLHIQIIVVCFLTAVVDGLDNTMLGYTAQEISSSMHIKLSAFGPIFSAGIVGLLVGAVLAGRLADRIGRRYTLILCTLAFSGLTLLTPLGRSTNELIFFRFIAGLGLGGAMPSFLTLVSEYAPSNRKAFAAGLLWCGYPAGGMVGGLLGSQLLPHFGWQVMFYIGGAVGFAVCILQGLFIPESLQFLALKGKNRSRIMHIARRIAPHLDFSDAQFVGSARAGSKQSVRDVFANGRVAHTLLLWLPLFFTFWTTTFFVNWAPTLFKASGMSASAAAFMVALNNFGTLPSQATTGYLVDRVGPFRVLPITYALLAFSIIGLGLASPHVPWVALCMLLAGFLMGPGIAGMVYLATAIYPSEIRSTGTGLAMGIGRSGQVVSSLTIGALVGAGIPANGIVMMMCVPSLIAIVSVILLGRSLNGFRDAKSEEIGLAGAAA